MRQHLESDPVQREFVSSGMPSAVVHAVEALVRDRREVREAHLVAVRQSRKAQAVPALVLITDDPSVVAALTRELPRVLQPHARPGIVTLTEADAALSVVRGVGGELKRGGKGFRGAPLSRDLTHGLTICLSRAMRRTSTSSEKHRGRPEE